ncbi:MAG: hypothetical protein ACO2ZJ_10690 [Pseudohongiellaceae bacterium]
MKKFLVVSVLIQALVLQVATAQIIPLEIDLSRQEPSFPFLPPDIPKQVTNLDQVQIIGPVSVLTEEGEYVTGNIKMLRGSMDSLITRINVQDSDSGETVKLAVDDIKSLIISTSVGVQLNRVINQHRAVTLCPVSNSRT